MYLKWEPILYNDSDYDGNNILPDQNRLVVWNVSIRRDTRLIVHATTQNASIVVNSDCITLEMQRGCSAGFYRERYMVWDLLFERDAIQMFLTPGIQTGNLRQDVQTRLPTERIQACFNYEEHKKAAFVVEPIAKNLITGLDTCQYQLISGTRTKINS